MEILQSITAQIKAVRLPLYAATASAVPWAALEDIDRAMLDAA
jgi:hypothetical protein